MKPILIVLLLMSAKVLGHFKYFKGDWKNVRKRKDVFNGPSPGSFHSNLSVLNPVMNSGASEQTLGPVCRRKNWLPYNGTWGMVLWVRVGDFCCARFSVLPILHLSPPNYLAGKTSKSLCFPPQVLRTHLHSTHPRGDN